MQHGIGTTHHPTVDFIHSHRRIIDIHIILLLIILLFIIYIRQSQQTEVFLLGALNDYEDAWGNVGWEQTQRMRGGREFHSLVAV